MFPTGKIYNGDRLAPHGETRVPILLTISAMMKDKLLDLLDKFLVLDVFVVLFSFFWFVTALVGRSLDIPLGLDLWYRLWEPVFTPAIGILMGGAILSWLLKKLSGWWAPRA